MRNPFSVFGAHVGRLFGTLAVREGALPDHYFAALQLKNRAWRGLALLMTGTTIVAVTAAVLIYFRYSPARPIVTVGGTAIHRRDYQAQLDAAAGRTVLTRLVFTELVKQAGAKAHLTPSPAQIDARLAEMQRRGLLRAGVPDGFRESLALDMTLENLRTQGVTASDAEIANFYRRNARALALPMETRTTSVLTSSRMAADEAAGLLRRGRTPAEVAAQPGMQVDGQAGFHLGLSNFPPALQRKVAATVTALRPGQVATLPLGDAQFLTVQCLRRLPSGLPPLAQIKDQIARMVKLQKAPSADAVIARLYQANRPDFDMDRYAAFFTDIDNANTAPSARLSQ